MTRFLPVLFCMILCLAGCVSSGEFSYDLSEKDSGITLRAKQGDTIRIVLESNPSTGFYWREDGRPDSDVVRQVFQDYQNKDSAPGKTGVPGHQIMIYKVVGSGDTGIRLGYSRSWEKNAPAQTFQIRLIAEPEEGFLEFLDNSKVPGQRVGSKGQVEPLRGEQW